MDDEDGFTTSDAELDSEIEDVDGELGVWLNQLNSYATQQNGTSRTPCKPSAVPSHMTVSPKQVMDTFRCSILDSGDGQDLDLDAILGELCQLETQLNTQQSEIKTSMRNVGMSDTPAMSPSMDPGQKSDQLRAAAPESNPDMIGTKNRDSLAELESALDDQLQSALSELSDLVGISFDTTSTAEDEGQAAPRSRPPEQGLATSYSTTQPSFQSSTVTQVPKKDELSVHKPSPGVPLKVTTPGTKTLHDGAIRQQQHMFQDYSPNGAEVDSAFSDSSSLPSSGSHVSVTTTSSQNSCSSSGTGYNSGSLGMANCRHVAVECIYGILDSPDIRQHLTDFRESLLKSDLSPMEQAAQLKAEKVRIALQKIKEANIQKLFVRFYSEDGCSKSILVDDSMRVYHVLDRLVAKNNVTPSVSWAVVEHLPDLYMERLIEDHELMVEPLLSWSHNTRNKLLFVQSPGKYHIFHSPELYLTRDRKGELSQAARESLIEEYFSDDSSRFPEVEGQLYLKSEGKKAWKKYFFVLRASGLYYNPKGKGKSAKDLICLQKLDVVEVYTAMSWKKKYKAPTDYGFALKHPQIQNKAPKYIKYLCAEDQQTFSQWVTGIRVAKHGCQLMRNYKQAKKNLETWNSREILPNQNFAEYLAKENERNQEFAKEHHLLPRKSVSTSATLADSLSESSDVDKQSLSSGTSQSSRSSTCSHDPDAASGSHGSMSGGRDGVRRRSGEMLLVNGTGRRGSLPAVNEGQLRPPGGVDFNQNRDRDDRSEDVRTPAKMIPSLPVTTQITRQLTDQNAQCGTLKRHQSYGTIKSLKRNLAANSNENRLPSPQKTLASTPDADDDVDDDDDDDDFPLPPPPPELLSPPIVEQTAYVGVGQRPVVYDVPRSRVGGSLPNSPQKKPPIYAKPVVSGGVVCVPPHSSSAPQSPVPHQPVPCASPPPPPPPQQPPWQTAVTSSAPPVASCQLAAGHRRVLSSPTPQAADTTRKPPPPPPPKRSETTRLSCRRQSPQTQYFLSDLQRVLDQKKAWSLEMGPEPSFPPSPPPHKPRAPQPPRGVPAPDDDECLPPPPAELLQELHEARSKKPPPPKPTPKRTTEHRHGSLRKAQSYESQA